MFLYKQILTMDARRGRSPKRNALESKLQIAQNKYICFCLGLPPRGHKSPSNFRKISWLPVERGLELYTFTTVYTAQE